MSLAVYEAVTARILDSLDRGVVPWRRPWGNVLVPTNAVSKKPYRGVNVLLLGLGMFRDHRFLTFRQAQGLGGSVRTGEKGMLVVFWKRLEFDNPDPETGEVRKSSAPMLRYYHVFNVEQCEGLSLPALQRPDPSSPSLRIEAAEALVASMPDPPQVLRAGSEAFYRPSTDQICIPRADSFASTDMFYATLFHELGHATGHERRLARPGVTGGIHFGSETYSREELVAEFTSAFCCARAGLDNSLTESAASYIDGWRGALRSDPKALAVAAAQAQRAADYIAGASPTSSEDT